MRGGYRAYRSKNMSLKPAPPPWASAGGADRTGVHNITTTPTGAVPARSNAKRERKRVEARTKLVVAKRLEKQTNQAPGTVPAAQVKEYMVRSTIDKIITALPKTKRPRNPFAPNDYTARPNQKRHSFQMRTSEVPWGGPRVVSLDEELVAFYEYIKLSPNELAARESVLRDMREAIKCKWPSAEVRPFGSYPAGLSIYSSDLDVTILGIELGRGTSMGTNSLEATTSASACGGGVLGATTATAATASSSSSTAIAATGAGAAVVALGDFEDLVDSEDSFVDMSSSEGEGAEDEDEGGDGEYEYNAKDEEFDAQGIPGVIIDVTGNRVAGTGEQGGGSVVAIDDEEEGDSEIEHSDSDDSHSSAINSALGKQKSTSKAIATPKSKRDVVFDDIEVNAVTPSNDRLELDFSKTTVQAPLRGGASAKSDGIKEGVVDMYRDERIQVLQSMCHFFGGMGWLEYIELRKRARVPIINLKHRVGIECDVSLGVAAEDTTAEVELMKLCFPEQFKVVAFFLKVFLSMHKLDKPFTGGIGSYKLYVMIAYIFRRVKKAITEKQDGAPTQSEPTAGFLLLTFLKFFGDMRNLNSATILKVHIESVASAVNSPSTVHMVPSADFKTAFKVDVCREAFRLAYQILNDNFEIAQMHGTALAQAEAEQQVGKKRKPLPASPESCIAKVLVDAKGFIKEREAVRMSCGGVSFSSASNNNNNSSSGISSTTTATAGASWPQRTEEDREAVAITILAALQRRLQITAPITMSDIYRTDPGVAVRLRSFVSLDDALRQIEASRSVPMLGYAFPPPPTSTSTSGRHAYAYNSTVASYGRVGVVGGGGGGAGFGGKKVRKVLIKATQSAAAQNALTRDGAFRTATAKGRVSGSTSSPAVAGGSSNSRGTSGNPYPFSMSVPSAAMGASSAFKRKRFFKPKYA